MKKRLVVLAMVLGLVLGLTGVAIASGDATLTVSATVNGTCKFSAGSATLAFGAIDPSNTSAATATTSITYKCTKGTAATGVTAGDGLHLSGGSKRVALPGDADFMTYTLTLTGGTQTGTGFGAAQDKTLTIDGTIAVADFQNATAGAYTDQVVLTINP
jgi:spore coat protein U-like protein